ncbi:MAG: hypothetical protein JOZ62_11435 [Acidobacteriaceae bacterium]|nr:hypothetical protein [Acidobacteriaceae bacterium]
MGRASRSNKKQPAFDPSELEDLIFTPAVGKGVGSHLVPPTRPRLPVVTSDVATVQPGRGSLIQTPEADVTTIDTSQSIDMPTVGTLTPTTVPEPKGKRGEKKLWITEHGDLVPAGRVKRIRLAQDIINSGEECVYDTLWNAKLIEVNERESYRLVQAGYDYLVKRTRFSRKTIQRIVAKLIEKDFIEVDTRADIYQRTATLYRVFSYKAVLERNLRKGREHAAKIGPGFAYAKPLEGAQPASSGSNMATAVESQPETTSLDMTTVVNMTTVTMVNEYPTTVVKLSPYLLEQDVLDNTSSSSTVYQALAIYGAADDDVVTRLIQACRKHAADCSEEEIVHFIHEKGALVRAKDSRVYNPIGFLAAAVPKCFAGEAFRLYREQHSKSRDAETAQVGENTALERWRREQEAALLDPNVSEQEKHLIRLCLGIDTTPS